MLALSLQAGSDGYILAAMDDLAAYWIKRLPIAGIAVSWEMAGAHCWRCARMGGLQRCHLIPASRGGVDEPSNLIRLCVDCHKQQPNVSDPGATWAWLATTQHDGGVRDTIAWMDVYESMYGHPPGQHGSPDTIKAALLAALSAAVKHYGEASLSPATIAACVRDAEETGDA